MDRRSFLRTAGSGVGVAALTNALPQSTFAAPAPRNHPNAIFALGARDRDSIASTLAPWSPAAGEWNTHTIGHLYRRAGFGATMAEIDAARTLTPSQVVDQLLDDKWTAAPNLPAPPAHSDEWLTTVPYLGSDLTASQKQQQDYYYATQEMRYWWAGLMTEPNTMLRERMTFFWSNHFVVEAQKVYFPQMLYHYLDYFRQHPWGNFKQMVKDITILPAMLYYLDGWVNKGLNPNENYARELMELFTLGVVDKDGNANYTEIDIHEVAKSLTGYTIDFASPAPNVVAAKYDVNAHDSRFKQPFGAPKKQYGLASSGLVQDDIIDALFQYKGDKLAYYICGKLYQQFVYHDITSQTSKDIISQLATTFQNANWELKPVIAQLLKSEHFFDEANIGASIKSPYDHMTGLARHLDTPLTDLNASALYGYGSKMDQSLFDPPNVKGWPGYHSWISTTTLPNRNEVVDMVASKGRIPAAGLNDPYGRPYEPIVWNDGSVLTWASQFADYKGSLKSFVSQVATFLTAQPPSSDLQQSLIIDSMAIPDYEWPTVDDPHRTEAIRKIVLIISQMPEFQLQ